MLDRWYKISTIGVAAVIIVSAIIGPSIGGIIWLDRLDRDVSDLKENVAQLQEDVGQLQKDVGQLQEDVGQLQEGQAAMLQILQTLADEIPEIRSDLQNHTHNSDGRAQLPSADN